MSEEHNTMDAARLDPESRALTMRPPRLAPLKRGKRVKNEKQVLSASVVKGRVEYIFLF